MSAATPAALRLAPRAGRDLASGIFASPLDLASGFSRSEPANDTGENGVAYDEVTSESCYWTSKDPTRFAGGENLYAYANNDPVNLVDRTGRSPEGDEGGSAESDSPNSDNYDEDEGICEDPEPAGECDDQYQWCMNNGPDKCLKNEAGKSQCQRCWERCNAGDSPSSICRECGF